MPMGKNTGQKQEHSMHQNNLLLPMTLQKPRAPLKRMQKMKLQKIKIQRNQEIKIHLKLRIIIVDRNQTRKGNSRHLKMAMLNIRLEVQTYVMVKLLKLTGPKKKNAQRKPNTVQHKKLWNPILPKQYSGKKLITSALKSNEDGSMKFKKLTKFALKSLKDSGYMENKKQLSEILEQKINSSWRFIVDGKYVRLATST